MHQPAKYGWDTGAIVAFLNDKQAVAVKGVTNANSNAFVLGATSISALLEVEQVLVAQYVKADRQRTRAVLRAASDIPRLVACGVRVLAIETRTGFDELTSVVGHCGSADVAAVTIFCLYKFCCHISFDPDGDLRKVSIFWPGPSK